MARKLGLVDAIDRELHLLKKHLPYSESDHVLNIAFNILMGGRSLEDLELLRTDENYLDALGTERIPDPTTAGDFCRRFEKEDVLQLLEILNGIRLEVWKLQPPSFFEEAVIDVDGCLTETSGECKQGMGIAYNGIWGFHPLLVTLANTNEVLWLANRSGNRPSEEGAAEYLDRSIELMRKAGFRSVRLRGDTAFSQTTHLDRWDADGVRFVFGYDSRSNVRKLAKDLETKAWKRFERPVRHRTDAKARTRPENVKARIVRERGFKNLALQEEHVAEVLYQPTACSREYRMVVLRKRISESRGQQWLFDDHEYFFYITNDMESSAAEIVRDANQRCDQENILKELKGEVRALHAPVNCLVSNWAYMVMASLAWSFKAWFGLLLEENGRWAEKHRAEKKRVLRMGFRTFLNFFLRLPTQIVRQGRKTIFRILGWNPMLTTFFRGWRRIRTLPRLC